MLCHSFGIKCHRLPTVYWREGTLFTSVYTSVNWPSQVRFWDFFFFNDSDLLEQIRNSSRKGLSCSPASTGPQQGGNLQEMNYSILHRPSDSHLDASPSHTCDSGTQDSSLFPDFFLHFFQCLIFTYCLFSGMLPPSSACRETSLSRGTLVFHTLLFLSHHSLSSSWASFHKLCRL